MRKIESICLMLIIQDNNTVGSAFGGPVQPPPADVPRPMSHALGQATRQATFDVCQLLIIYNWSKSLLFSHVYGKYSIRIGWG